MVDDYLKTFTQKSRQRIIKSWTKKKAGKIRSERGKHDFYLQFSKKKRDIPLP